ITSSAAIISIADTSVAFLSGLMIFPMIAALNAYDVSGPSLIFVVLAKVFASMDPMIGRIVGGSFFLLICFAALTSTISLLEVPAAFLVDQKKMKRRNVVWGLALLIFVLGIPSMISQGMVPVLNKLPFYKDRDFLSFVSDICDISLTIGGCLMSVFIAKKWGMDNFNRELALGNEGFNGSFVKGYLNVIIRYVSPVLLSILSVLIIIEKFFGIEAILGG
ncbi:MAG: sodium-dependent transporter, partial [Cyclobacteriaceae bacterium]